MEDGFQFVTENRRLDNIRFGFFAALSMIAGVSIHVSGLSEAYPEIMNIVVFALLAAMILICAISTVKIMILFEDVILESGREEEKRRLLSVVANILFFDFNSSLGLRQFSYVVVSTVVDAFATKWTYFSNDFSLKIGGDVICVASIFGIICGIDYLCFRKNRIYVFDSNM